MGVEPYDRDTEDIVLGSIIYNVTDYDNVSKYFTDIEVFYQPKARRLWKKITEMRRTGQPIDAETNSSAVTKQDIENGVDNFYIGMCVSNACVEGMTEIYANKVYQKYLMRNTFINTPPLTGN